MTKAEARQIIDSMGNFKNLDAENCDAIVRQVIRGERPWTDLRAQGMKLFPEEGRAEDIPPQNVMVDLHDMARGFLTHLNDPQALKQWSFVMEALPTDFQAERHPAGEAVMDLLWNASFGQLPDEAGVALLMSLAQKNTSLS